MTWIRWGDFVEDMNELIDYARAGGEWNQGPSNVYTYFQVSSTYNYFPIPDAEMAVNKAITSNNPVGNDKCINENLIIGK